MVQGIKDKDIKRFEKTCEKLAKIMEDIRQYNPNAGIFCNMDSLELHGYEYDNDNEFHYADPVISCYIEKLNCGER